MNIPCSCVPHVDWKKTLHAMKPYSMINICHGCEDIPVFCGLFCSVIDWQIGSGLVGRFPNVGIKVCNTSCS